MLFRIIMGNSTSQSEQVRSVKNKPIVVRVKRNTSIFENNKRNSDIPKSIVKDQKDPRRSNYKNRQANGLVKEKDPKSISVKDQKDPKSISVKDHKSESPKNQKDLKSIVKDQKDLKSIVKDQKDLKSIVKDQKDLKSIVKDQKDLKSESLKNHKDDSLKNQKDPTSESLRNHRDDSLKNLKNELVKDNDRKKWKNEEICRNILEDIFMQEFPSTRPDFLVNPYTGKNLELDCYNADLRLACEYNGKQHYMYTPFFHNSEEDFIKQVYRDNLKKRLCYENDIELISVPYFMNEHQIRYYIEHSILNYVEHLILSEKLKNINLKNCVLLNHYLRARDRFKIVD
jgi:hypothetical protein